MLKVLFIAISLIVSLNAQVEHKYPYKKIFSNKNLTIIDIRTEAEWIETGIVKNSHLITFFDEKGSYNIPKFMSELSKVTKKGVPFALICRTGSRTRLVSDFLDKNGYRVINLLGGIMYAKSTGVKLVKYRWKPLK